jgi:hypothetical protein
MLAGFGILGLACASSSPKLLASAAPPHLNASVASPAAESAAPDPRRTPDLFVGCADRSNCPSAVGMLVLDDNQGPEPERCTAALIAPDRVLTAEHCLSDAARHDGAACDSTWITFPQTQDAPAEWAACARVVHVSGAVSEDALQQEHAVLQLARALARKPLEIDPRPVEPNSIVEVVSVTPHPIYGSTHELTARLCRAIDAGPAVEALGENAARVGWLGNCPILRGNSGSPVLDHEGRIRAIVHGGTASVFAVGVTSGL